MLSLLPNTFVPFVRIAEVGFEKLNNSNVGFGGERLNLVLLGMSFQYFGHTAICGYLI